MANIDAKEEKKDIKKSKEPKKNNVLNELKKLFKRHKAVSIIILIAVLAAVVVLIITMPKNDNNENKNDNTNVNEQQEENTIISTEETIKNEYGFTKDDAINVIKKMYHSDNYTFYAKARKDNMYEVIVNNRETKKSDIYEVNPNDGSYRNISDIKED